MSVDTGNIISVPRKRWLRCFILHILISSIFWVFLGSNISSFCFWSCRGRVRFLISQRFLRFLGFVASQIVFLIGEAVVTHPEDKDAASAADIFFGVSKLAWRAIVGASLDSDSAQDAAILVRKLQSSRDRALFVFLCAISGSLSIISLTWSYQSRLSAMEEACRGTALGLLYAFLHLYTRRMILIFPIIQRPTFFCFKLGLVKMIRTAFKLAVASIPFAEAAILILNSSTLAAVGANKSGGSLFMRELDFMVSALSTAILWETCHHLIQILHTKHHRFSPPFGSSAAETSPIEMLLIALEETEKSSLARYLAVHDLCMLSENSADIWRLCALFEETGETYQRVVSECLKPLDVLTLKLAKGLDGFTGVSKKDFLKQQMQSPGQESVLSTYQIFDDYQLCSWCARIVAAVTAFSKNNDQYGVAQLRGCNGAVMSSLLSCLLVMEVYLGRRSTTQPGQVVGVHSIKWTVPSRVPVADSARKQGFPFLKKSELHKKAYAMADVLRTSLYQIVATFRKEMILSGCSPGRVVIAERDWLCKGQPLYGTHELHVQNLCLLLDFRM